MATTTKYGWTTPDDTALVKDGAAAIRTLGSSVDTTTKNLNPETTLGDIAYRSSTSNVNTRLGIGTSGQVLAVSGGVPAWTTTTPTFSGVFVRQSASTTSISNNTNTTVLFDSEEFDTDAYHSTSTNTGRITIPAGKAGKYAINSAFFFQDNGTGARRLQIFKNGSVYASTLMPPDAVSQISVTLNLVMDLAVSDYIEAVVFQNSGVSLTIYGGSAPIQGIFCASLIGA